MAGAGDSELSLTRPCSPGSPHLCLSAGLLLSRQYRCSPALQGTQNALIIVWEAVRALQYLPRRYLKATRPWREAEATELLRSRFWPHGGSGINPPLAPGTWPQLPDGD